MALTWTYESFDRGPSGDRVQYQHKVEIIDREGGLSGTFCGRNAVLSMNNPSRDVLGPLIASTSFSFEMKIEQEVHEQFILGLTEFSERRFIVKYSRNGILSFVGMIFLDEVTVQFTNKVQRDGALKPNGFFNVSAIDGMTTLKDVDFVQDDGLPYLDRASLGETLAICFESLPTIGFGQKAVLRSNWEPDVGGADIFTGTEVQRKIFVEEGRQGGYKFMSKYDVLKKICQSFDLRLSYTTNTYFFEQMNARQGSANIRQYSLPDFTPTFIFKGFSPVIDIDCNYKWRLSPDIRTYLPPYNSVKVEYKFDFLSNYAAQIEWVTPGAGSIVCYSDLGKVPVPDADTYRARWAGTFQIIPIEGAGGTLTGVYTIVYRLRIKIGNQYFIRPIQGTAYYNNTVYQAAEWTTTAGFFEYVDPSPIILPGDFGIPRYVPFYLTTLYIPQSLDDEQLELCLGFEVFDEDNNSITPIGPGGFGVNLNVTDADFIVVEGDDTVVESTQIDKIIFNGTGGTNTRGHTVTIPMSTGPTKASSGALSDDSVPPVFQEEWTGDQGTYSHYELLARTLMSRAMNTQEFMEGRIKGAFLTLTSTVGYDGAEWVPLRINYLTELGQYDGEWWKLNIGDASGLTDTEEDVQLINRLPSGFGTAWGPNNQPTVYSWVGEYTCIDVDANGMNIPDLTGWDEDRIWARIEVYKQGVGLLYYKFEGTRVDEWWWDNANRQICLGEQTRSQDKLVIRVWF